MDGEGISPKLIGGCIEIINIIFLFECEEYQRASVDYILQYVQSFLNFVRETRNPFMTFSWVLRKTIIIK